MPDLGIFGAGIWKQCCHIWIQHLRVFRNLHPQICLIAKFSEKTKMRKFETKIPYLGISDPK